MGFFGGIKRTIKMASISTELELLLDECLRTMPVDFHNGKLANKFVSEAWDHKKSIFEAKGNLQPTKLVLAAVALSHGIESNEFSEMDKHALLMTLGMIINKARNLADSSNVNQIDNQIILQFEESFEEYLRSQ